MALKKEKLTIAFVASIISFIALAGREKLGMQREGVIISWSGLLEQIPSLLIFSCLFGLIIYFFLILFTGTTVCMMCAKCEKSFMKPFKLNDEQIPICDICGSRLEKLEGFYDRHLGLKDDNKTKD